MPGAQYSSNTPLIDYFGISILAVFARNRIKSAKYLYLILILNQINYVNILNPILIATKITNKEVINARTLLEKIFRFI